MLDDRKGEGCVDGVVERIVAWVEEQGAEEEDADSDSPILAPAWGPVHSRLPSRGWSPESVNVVLNMTLDGAMVSSSEAGAAKRGDVSHGK